VAREAIHGGAEKKVYLAVDARAKYGDAFSFRAARFPQRQLLWNLSLKITRTESL
jgi:hypothetical protein